MKKRLGLKGGGCLPQILYMIDEYIIIRNIIELDYRNLQHNATHMLHTKKMK